MHVFGIECYTYYIKYAKQLEGTPNLPAYAAHQLQMNSPTRINQFPKVSCIHALEPDSHVDIPSCSLFFQQQQQQHIIYIITSFIFTSHDIPSTKTPCIMI